MAVAPAGVSRDEAFLSLSSPLGQDGLLPTALRGQEGISQLFHFTVDALSGRETIRPDELLAMPVCVHLRHRGQAVRHVHGVVQSFSATGPATRGFWGYRLGIVPKLWFLGQTEDCRVFQQKSSVDIIRTLLADAQITQVSMRVYARPPVRPYTVQYNESDLTFMTRLMQEDGLFWFFEHSETAHTLVITDANTVFQPIPGDALRLVPAGAGTYDCITAWHPGLVTAHGTVALGDYDPTAPGKQLSATVASTLGTGGAKQRDFYHWPARATDPALVKQHARIRMDAAEAAAGLAEGQGYTPGFVPGGTFRLQNDLAGAGTYAIHSVTHEATDESNLAGGTAITYANRFTAFDASRPWRDEITVPRPRMDGIHSAVVIGVSGEEIYTDDLARVKIRFHWDRLGASGSGGSTADGSCWVRVVQPWAGNGWGWQSLPRVGTEVAVAFMNGDVDQPVVIGGLYNGEQKPVFPQSEKTKSGLRSRSTLRGETADFSEFSIDDKKGNEMVLLHAQKDQTVAVENDRTLSVGHDETVKVDNDQSVTVGHAQTVKISSGRSVTIQSGGDALKVEGGDLGVTVETGSIALKASTASISAEALESITLTVGQSSVKIEQTGVTISGMMVKVQGQMELTLQGLMTNVKADAMLVVKGGIVMLN